MSVQVESCVLPPEIEEKDVVLKRQHTFSVLSEFGDIRTYRSEGIFYRNSRHLTSYRSRLGGEPLLFLSHNTLPSQDRLVVHLVNAEGADSAGVALGQTSVYGKRTITVEARGMTDLWEWTNYSERTLEVPFELYFQVDFADIFEVRHWLTARSREVESRAWEGGIEFSYQGGDGSRRATRVEWDSTFSLLSESDRSLRAELSLQPGETIRCKLEFSFTSSSAPLQRMQPVTWQNPTRVVTSNAQVNKWIEQSRRDLEMLTAQTPQGPYPFAGTPWFAAIFGRDGLITALRCLWLWPALSEGVLRVLAAHQATEEDLYLAAEPGKILHEMRDTERANLGDVPFGRYYGAVDSTPLFIILAGAYFTRTGDETLLHDLWPSLVAAGEWMERKLDQDRHGFLTYRSQPDGLLHQGWRDADNAVYHRDGTSVQGDIALIEVQAYCFRALRELAKLARRIGDHELADASLVRAKALRQRFEEAFWDEDLKFYVMALDSEARPCRLLSSAPGHAMWMGLVDPQRAEHVARAFASRKFWSGWGLRTVAEGEPRYSPLSYHNGSVWPHDTALCAEGLSRYGFRSLARRLFSGLFHATEYLELRRLPELFCGFRRAEGGGVVRFPGACSPQAWAAVTPFSLLTSLLGLRVQGEPPHISFTHPQLPEDLESVTVHDLQVGPHTVSFTLESTGSGTVKLDVLENRGGCEIDLLL